MRTPVSIGIVGLGSWGSSFARVLEALPQANVCWLCDRNPEVQLRVKPLYPNARVTGKVEDLIEDESLDAVVLATPLATRYELAHQALEADKHVLVEGLLALRGDHADELVRCAVRRGRRLMVGHVLLFHPAIRRLKELIDLGHLGDVYYVYSERQSFGRIRKVESVLWTLGAHDVSAILHLLLDEPVEVAAHGESYVHPGVTDVVICSLKFATGITAQMHLSLLDPRRMRRLTVVGSERMATFDDIEPERKLSIFEKGASSQRLDPLGWHVPPRLGDIVSPSLPGDDPLELECRQFLKVVRSPGRPANGHTGAEVVHVLEALSSSLDSGGLPEPVGGGHRAAPVVRLPVEPR